MMTQNDPRTQFDPRVQYDPRTGEPVQFQPSQFQGQPYQLARTRRFSPAVIVLASAFVVAVVAALVVVIVVNSGSTKAGGTVAPVNGGQVVPNGGGQVPNGGGQVVPNGGGQVVPSGGGQVVPSGGGQVDPNGGGQVDPNGGGQVPNGGGQVDPNGGGQNGGGDRPPGNFASQQGAIVDAALKWTDARNAGNGDLLLQLSCSDDVAAVQSGQPNPASYAGYSAVRPTGKVAAHSSGRAGYVEMSQQNLKTAQTSIITTPVIWENGSWRLCYYPGAAAQRIAGGS